MIRYATLSVLACLLVTPALAEDASPPAEPDAGVVWHEVRPGVFEVKLELSGTVQGAKSHAVVAELDEWQALELIAWPEQGAAVKKGDVLLRFDTTDIDRAIADQEVARAASAIALQDAEAELAAMEKTVPLDLAQAERDAKRARENLDRWNGIEKDLYVTAVGNVLQSAQFTLDYQREELRQLKRMYAEDSITEETEEIILKRQEWSVALAQDALTDAKAKHEFAMKTDLARRQEDTELSFERTQLNLAKLRQTLPLSLESKRRAVVKMRHEAARAEEKIARLKADRDRMTLAAPAAGVVYYGEIVNGKWTQAETVAGLLKPRGSIKPGSTLLTVVEPRPVTLRATVKEADVRKVKPGAAVLIAPTADADARLGGKVAEVAPLPLGEGFPVTIEVDGDDVEALRPGMSAKATVQAYRSKDALSIPREALRRDDRGRPIVIVEGEGGKEVERAVKLGWSTSQRVEIVDGLKAGERVKGAKSVPAAADGEKK